LVVHYDGLIHPSEVCIEAIMLWVRMYDLPPVMMKESCAKQLGGQLGKYIKMDSRYPVYLRIRVEFPLSKPMVPKLIVKIRGKGNMEIMVKYENVPHFCFTCGRIGHAAASCEEGDPVDQGIIFTEDLRESPPRRTREISISQGLTQGSPTTVHG
jgi:hypothetical protein